MFELGASMAIVDAMACLLLVFTEFPLFSVGSSRFATIGRMLVSVGLISKALPKILFSMSACALEVFMKFQDKSYNYALAFSCVAWFVQAISVTTAVSTVFVAPSAFFLTRSVTEDTTIIAILLYVVTFCISLPAITKTCVAVVKMQCVTDKSL